jgi:hypothetical protein
MLVQGIDKFRFTIGPRILCRQEFDLILVDLHKTSNDALGLLSPYGRHLMHLVESHEMLILKGMPFFSAYNTSTCFPHSGGAIVVDYVVANQGSTSCICQFLVTLIPLVDHALLSFFL